MTSRAPDAPSRRSVVLGLAATGAALSRTHARAAPTAPAAMAEGLELGVQTHFSQGWSPAWMPRAKGLRAPFLRDGLAWNAVEQARGRFDFEAGRAAYLDLARKAGLRVLLAIDPKNRLYDGGETAFGPEARQAFAGYLNAILDRYGDVVWGFEVGNELNVAKAVTGAAAKDPAAAHVALLRTVWGEVKARHPDVQILGGSVNVVGTGFLRRIFEAGGLEAMDAVAVHPYRSHPEHVDQEIADVQAAMEGLGPRRPVHATEFSNQFETPEEACDHLLKMTTLMGAAGVRRASWYALAEERWFPNMGLFETDGRPKPASEAFAFVQSGLLPHGPPARRAEGPRAFVFRYGDGPVVAWGSPRPLRLKGDAKAFDSRGRPIPLPDRLGEAPVVLAGAFELELGPSRVLADSFYDYGQPPWSYFARTPDGRTHPLRRVDWEWTSYLGDRYFKPLRFNADSLAPAGEGKTAIRAVLRYTAPAAQAGVMRLDLKGSGRGDGVDVAVSVRGAPVRSWIVTGLDRSELPVDLKAGDPVEISVGPNQASGGDVLNYRIQLIA